MLDRRCDASASLRILATHPAGIGLSIGAKAGLETGDSQITALLGHHSNVIFTRGGGKANILALKGTLFDLRDKGNQIITNTIKHLVIHDPCWRQRYQPRGTIQSIEESA